MMKDLQELIRKIVSQAEILKNNHTLEKDALVNYACVFSQSREEYKTLLEVANLLGKVIKETPTGLLFYIKTIDTSAGPLKLLKIRISDPTRPERGDADFTINNYSSFKNKYLSLPGFKLIKRDNMEMIELKDFNFNVRAYFSNPPLDQQLNIR